MHIILTHEQADFDAVAALLAVALLDEHAIPVLPSRVNRNVRAFLNLYSSELPFKEQNDLPRALINQITLVDTQSLVTIKGITTKTKVFVFDHHQGKPNSKNDWVFRIDPIGATTTLLVEALQEQGYSLNRTQAVLFLLGIYEDTGSLSYTCTTARDAAAAAYLLDQGASLRILNDFLNPPLSQQQRCLYDQLLKSAESITINGLNVIISCATAEDTSEEISSIAHKLRDLLEPDALFILVYTKEGIRLICRSTCDQVNVAHVASEFGGGGHERAAGALIHLKEADHLDPKLRLDENTKKLRDILSHAIKPAITVGQIMSGIPIQLSPSTSAQEAHSLMQKYGYEGYPIVDQDRLIGLLTRRAVDRALTHKLNITAGSLMESGNVNVSSHDSLETLQKRMADNGWGQVPVVDSDNKIIGIVTRTDLLKTLASRENIISHRLNLSDKMKQVLSMPHFQLLLLVASNATEKQLPIYLVGGPVRDILLNRSSPDLDLVVEGDAIHFARNLVSRFGGIVTSHIKFGTAKWKLQNLKPAFFHAANLDQPMAGSALPESLDFITARTEFYDFPTALPKVERSNIKLDLHRRDFTINTMALRLDGSHFGEIFDYYGGMKDLQNGLIRVLHSLSFVDDPTRLLRAIRFEQRFGFMIENRTLELMNESAALLQKVSGDRLRHEFNLILSERDANAMLIRLDQLGMLKKIHSSLNWSKKKAVLYTKIQKNQFPLNWDLPENFAGLPLKLVLYYTSWLFDYEILQIEEIAQRLKFPQAMTDAIKNASKLNDFLSKHRNISNSQATAAIEGTPSFVLLILWIASNQSFKKPIFENYMTKWRKVRSKITGADLKAEGIPPGIHYHLILDRLRNAWLDEEINNHDEEFALLKTLIQEFAPKN